MAAISNISLQFPGNLTDAKKDNNVLRLSFCSPRNTTNMSSKKRRFLSVSASYSDSPRKIDTANRVNVNGIHVAEAPLQAGKLANDPSAADEAIVTSLRGRFVEGKFVFRQIFVIRSYEIGPDKTATMETIMNFLQVSFTIQASTNNSVYRFHNYLHTLSFKPHTPNCILLHFCNIVH